MGKYRAEENHLFSAQEKQILDYLIPVLVSFTHTMMLYSQFDLKRVSIDKLAGSQKALTISFNDRLVPMDIPKEIERFINRYFLSAGQRFIPDSIDRWIREQIAPKGCTANKAYTVVTDLKQLVLFVMLIPQNRPIDFSILQSEGPTKREVEMLATFMA